MTAAGLSACGGEAPLAGPPAIPAEDIPDGWPRNIEGFAGELELRAPPRRILPASSSAVDFVLDLIGEERVVAIPEQALNWANALDAGSELRDGKLFGSYSTEVVLGFAPDLVLTHVWQSANASRALAQAGVPVLVLPELKNTQDIRLALRTLGQALGAESNAEELIAGFETRLSRLASTDRSSERILTYSNGGTGGWSAGKNTTADLLIGLCGAVNAASEAGLDGHSRMDFELLLSLDPDWILVSGGIDGEASGSLSFLMAQKVLSSLSAVQNDRIISVPAALFSTTSHYILDAAEYLAGQLDRVESVDQVPSKDGAQSKDHDDA